MDVGKRKEAERERGIIKERITQIESVCGVSLRETLLSIEKTITLFPNKVVLEVDEFLSLLFLFDTKPSFSTAASIFRILLVCSLTQEQIFILFSLNSDQREKNDLYWRITWTFLDRTVSVKRAFICFAKKLVKKEPNTAQKVIRLLLLFMSDEERKLRGKSYSGVCSIYKKYFNQWPEALQKEFKASAKCLGKETVRIIRKEYKEERKKQSKAEIEIEKLSLAIRVSITIGKKYRQRNTTYVLLQEEGSNVESKMAVRKKKTIIYFNPECNIICSIVYKNSIIKRKSISSRK